jgi:hypothetical protein
MTNFGDKEHGNRRPSTTIEGTATEIVEPSPELSAQESEPDRQEETAADKDESQAKPKRVPPRTGPIELQSFLTHLAAGLLGGLVGVLALSFYRDQPADVAAPDMSAIETRLSKLESVPAPSTDAGLTDLTARVSKLEADLNALTETAKQGGSVADAAAVNALVNDAELRLQKRIDEKLTEVETQNRQTLDQMQSAVKDLSAKLESATATGQGGDTAALDELKSRIATLESTVSQLGGKVSEDRAGAESAAAVLALANLRSAVDAGRPYATELATLRSLAPGIGNFGALPAFAEQGIPTNEQLTASFKTASDAALDAVPAPVADDDSIVGSVLRSAESMVRVRRIDGSATGDDPESVISRATGKLKKGELVEAIQTVDALQGAPRQALSSWIDAARARATADDTLNNLQTTLRANAESASPARNQSP